VFGNTETAMTQKRLQGGHMKTFKMIFGAAIVLLLVSSAATAADFDWVRDFNIRAEADISGFRVRLAARFQMADAQVSAVLGNVNKPSDAYMVMRLGEMAKRPPEDALKEYRTSKGNGWGALAKSLGIKPGSPEFQALKQGNDLYEGSGRDNKPEAVKEKDKKKSKGKSKHKG
jgi:hypothetical protein